MNPHNLVREIGQRLGITLALDETNLARLLIDNTLPVDFEVDESQDRLLVYSVIGMPPVGDARAVFFQELLAANLFGSETGACSPAYDAVREELLLWFDLKGECEVDSAMAKLEQLVAVTEHWQLRLARGNSGEASSGEAAPGILPELISLA